ncbi:hypothetical protein D9C73_000810 [Collichthys lucidus]|uniref:Uncharacterized protein n=1 Tax=Collichthys lucidus TaxID=240159 RepID=A0A4U5U1E5_COLLU|nr:hypothetical protein D9C73_000810 [Collichthys lucidus]
MFPQGFTRGCSAAGSRREKLTHAPVEGSSEGVLRVVDAEEASPPLLHLRGGGETGTNFLCDLHSAEFSLAASQGGLWLCRPGRKDASCGCCMALRDARDLGATAVRSHKCGLFTPVGQSVPAPPPSRDPERPPRLSSVAADSVSGAGLMAAALAPAFITIIRLCVC